MVDQPVPVKSPARSKTVWAGLGVTLLGAAGIAVQVWDLIDPEMEAYLDSVFGPTTMTVIGILMLVLRVVTTKPIR